MRTPALPLEVEARFDYLVLAGIVQDADVVDGDLPFEVSLQQERQQLARDVVLEIGWPEGEVRTKIPFYAKIGVGQLILIDRDNKQVEVFRGSGGKLLPGAEQAWERGCGRLEWVVLEWNTHAIEFYERFGAQHMNDWLLYRLDRPALERLASS